MSSIGTALKQSSIRRSLRNATCPCRLSGSVMVIQRQRAYAIAVSLLVAAAMQAQGQIDSTLGAVLGATRS